MKVSQRELTLGVITLVSLMVGVTWYVMDDKLAEHKAKGAEITRLEGQIRIDERRVKMQDEWMAELEELQRGLRLFDIKKKIVSPDLMDTINNIADKHGLNIIRNHPRPEVPTDDLFEMAITCPWEGELEALVGFLAELQQQGARYDIRMLDISPVGKNTGRLKGSMVLHCAYIKKILTEEEKKAIAEAVAKEKALAAAAREKARAEAAEAEALAAAAKEAESKPAEDSPEPKVAPPTLDNTNRPTPPTTRPESPGARPSPPAGTPQPPAS